MLHQELDSCIAVATQLGLETYLYTSGILYDCNGDRKLRSLTQAEALRLQESGIHRVYLSINGASEYVHDALCGTVGSLNLAMESLKLLLSNNIEVGIHYLVTKTNLKELSSAANALFQLGIHDFKPLKLVFQGHAFDKRADLALSLQDQIEFRKQMRLLYLKYGERLTLGCFWGKQFSDDIECPSCKAGQQVLTVKADGNVVPCGANKFQVIGNIRTSNLSDIWCDFAELHPLSSYEQPLCSSE